MDLVENRNYYVASRDAVLREKAAGNSAPVNHLLFGDWMRYKGETKNGWAKVRCRNCDGWLPISAIREDRILEVNFVDIGQGDGCHIVTPDDEVILIDAGEGNNMLRFLSWRYNLRGRKRPEDGGGAPFPLDHVFISHPDKDHYYGLLPVFEETRLKPLRVYHNGIVERPQRDEDKDPDLQYLSSEDLGGYLRVDGERYLWELISSSSAMHALIDKFPTTGKLYLKTLRQAAKNNPDVQFIRVAEKDRFIAGFEDDQALTLKVLGPLTERHGKGNAHRDTLIKLGDEGVTKNGHSIILQLRIGRLKVMLGGDLNTESEDYLFRHYGETDKTVSELEAERYRLLEKGNSATADERQTLEELALELETIITRARRHFRADVTKACHHGSHHFSEAFLQAIDAIASVISSGDDENYAHPRPDALGAFGKYSRGRRPLIFSTELARNTREFTPVIEYIDTLRRFEAELAAATSASERRRIQTRMNEAKDRNVVVYGMITLRTDGERVVIAQKLEVSGGNDNKWDIHELTYNDHTGGFEYQVKTGSH